MEIRCIINKKTLRADKTLRKNFRKSKRLYGRKGTIGFDTDLKTRLGKLTNLKSIVYMDLTTLPTTIENERVLLTKDELINLCQEANLTGRSGDGFPMANKLKAFAEDNGTLIINGVECDPGLVTDTYLFKNRIDDVINGARILKNALDLKRIILATKEAPKEIPDIECVKVVNKFPLGYENYLIKYLLGIEIKDTELPQEKGILVMNLQSVLAISEASTNPEKGKCRYLTVSDLTSGISTVIFVPIGTKVSDIANRFFLQDDIKNHNIYVGGGAFNLHKMEPDEIVLDTTGYIALGDMTPFNNESKCKNCNSCTRHCPAGVDAHKLVRYIEANGFNSPSSCKIYNVDACVGCGMCTFNCIGGKDIRELVMWAKLSE